MNRFYGETITYARRGDILRVGDTLKKQIEEPINNFDDVLKTFPQLETNVQKGFNGLGRQSFLILEKNPLTVGTIVIAAMEQCMALPHFHVGREVHTYGEMIITLAGNLEEHDTYNPTIYSGQNQCFLWKAGSVHQPQARNFWCGIYHQPGGLKLLNRLTWEDMNQAMQVMHGLNLSEAILDAEILPHEDLQLNFSQVFNFHLPQQTAD